MYGGFWLSNAGIFGSWCPVSARFQRDDFQAWFPFLHSRILCVAWKVYRNFAKGNRSMGHNPGFEQLVETVKSTIRECLPEDVRRRIDEGVPFHFIDVREDHEFAQGYAKGAIHLGRGIIERDIESLIPDHTADIVLYCGGGYRSALAAANLQAMGYSRVWSMAGGIKGWRKAGYEVVQPSESGQP